MRCFVGLGSSLGDRAAHLSRAVRELEDIALPGSLRLSRVLETDAVLPPGAPPEWQVPYLNAVAELEWRGSPRALLKALKSIERKLGREPAPRWSPRVIDLDLLLYGNLEWMEPGLNLPHASLWERSFVLDPLCELAPRLRIPGRGVTVTQRAFELREEARKTSGGKIPEALRA